MVEDNQACITLLIINRPGDKNFKGIYIGRLSFHSQNQLYLIDKRNMAIVLQPLQAVP